MKKITLIIFVLFLFNISFSQIIITNKRQSFLKKIELERIDTMNVEFIHILPHGRIFSLKITCEIDYGQKRGYFKKKSKIRFEDTSKRKFNSDAEIINFVSSNGWEYIEYDSYAFVFRRKKK